MECGAHQSTKPQTPSFQRSSKSQAPNKGPSDVVAIQGGALWFGAWNFSGPSSAVAALSHPSSASCLLRRVEAWRLGFEASQASSSTENSEEPASRWRSDQSSCDAIKKIENNPLLK
jgi:hypothetical protein